MFQGKMHSPIVKVELVRKNVIYSSMQKNETGIT